MLNKRQVILRAKQNLYCLKQEHEGQGIDYICVDPDCKQQSQLFCYMCSHSPQHDKVNLKILISKLLQIEHIGAGSLKKSATFDMRLQTISDILTNNSEHLSNPQQVFALFQQYCQLLQKKAIKSFTLADQFHNISMQTPASFQRMLANFIKNNQEVLTLLDEKQNIEEINLHERTLERLVEDLDTIIESLRRFEKDKTIDDYHVLSLFPLVSESYRSFKLMFSDSLKGSCMSVDGNKVQMTTSGTQRVLALEPSLESNYRIKKWKIKIVKLASWIGIGACHVNKLKADNWNFNYSNTQHGSYFISSNGYSWSSYKPEFNSKFQSFTFKTGDIIAVEYNPKQKMLKYSKEQTEEVYNLQVESNGDPLYPALNLTGIGDSVQIVQ